MALAIAVVAGMTATIFLTSGSGAWAAFGLVVLSISLARFFLTTRYEIGPAGIEMRTAIRSVRRPWSDFASFRVEREGVFLSTHARPSRLENFRGIFLLARDRKQEVAEVVRAALGKVGPPGAATDDGAPGGAPGGGSPDGARPLVEARP